jgi:hypothetical protein
MSFAPPDTKAIDVFLSYAHADEGMRDKLDKHLAIFRRRGVITVWHDRKILVGEEWAGRIDEQINVADIILLLVSSDFLSSDYCYSIEMERALKRYEDGEACVIPVILRPCYWQEAPFGKLQALPKDAKPITTWLNDDEAYLSVAQGIRSAVERLIGSSGNDITITHPVQESANIQSRPSGTRWEIVLGGTIDDVNKHRALEFFISVQKLLSDPTLRLIEIKSGSIVLVLEGSREAFDRMKSIVQSGQLDKLLEFEIKEISEAQDEEWDSNQLDERSPSNSTLKELAIDCAKSIQLLSEFRAGALDENQIIGIRAHLIECDPCMSVFSDMETIILAAAALKNGDISYPDENVIWERIEMNKKIVH